ncbi:MAG: hypothetical protein CM1200mP41_07630 [Gammaproteobacteria bacterium]|nr:MAG: hypothetical protein CM1200mP41_07630 [Gammaproteobacteria bacterium]
MDLHHLIRSLPDYPKPGIIFRDITTLLREGEGFKERLLTNWLRLFPENA